MNTKFWTNIYKDNIKATNVTLVTTNPISKQMWTGTSNDNMQEN